MPVTRPYASKYPDARGRYSYGREDNAVWQELFQRQVGFLPGRICQAYLGGIDALGLTADRVPQVRDVDRSLRALTGFGAQGVPALIAPKAFFGLLAAGKFPVATFLRRREDIDYIQEPDIFHEVFGHCPMLTNQAFADFVRGFGVLAQALGRPYSWRLFRLFWFTVEFGMIRTPDGLRGYGAGIASSPSEAAHACSGAARYRDFDLLEIFRTDYRIDIVQPVYFVIDSFDQLAACLDADIAGLIDRAKALGDLPVQFERAA